uniref:Translation elongation factor EF1B beta/delta subunit guanine nucleotide exchange domain-containing protein n=1 Tax=Cercocebus atys TaxID=9531 RepID=A0A2K5MJQ0_CERAT
IATNFLVHEKIWLDKFKYKDAERKFYEQMNGPVASTSRQTGPPSWCPWATVSGSCIFSVWWRIRWGQTCWRRRSPSLRSMCRVWTSQLSTRSEP